MSTSIGEGSEAGGRKLNATRLAIADVFFYNISFNFVVNREYWGCW